MKYRLVKETTVTGHVQWFSEWSRSGDGASWRYVAGSISDDEPDARRVFEGLITRETGPKKEVIEEVET